MATAEQDMETDPITAALPPKSDYITYLTVLEYQLTPDRLPVLTKHLAEDDGTLAKEIGWDLVKLILPLVDAAPNDAAKCLEVVARRGNPREVVVRLAESLETLGAEDAGSESGLYQNLVLDESISFKGEAQPIHLGEMRLQGMPPDPAGEQDSGENPAEYHDASVISDSLDLQFSTLLSVLALLHARIKTQYPSRFLATSLPAALGAYRRIPITSTTTSAFITLLGRMSGKQRPTLPPRSSTVSLVHLPSAAKPGIEVYAPLPDPEGRSEENAKAPSDLEKSIVLRLLQAVTLEVLEEFLLADSSTMEWSTRLLEKTNPQKSRPDRTMRLKVWEDDEELKSKDMMMHKFLRLANDLGLNAEDVFKNTNLPLVGDKNEKGVSTGTNAGKGNSKDEDEEPSEFPNSPSQIPFSHLGALFLFLASKISEVAHLEEKISPLDISMADLHHFVNQFVVPTPILIPNQLIPSVGHNHATAIDSLLSLLLLTLPPQYPSASVFSSIANDDHRSLITILSYISAENANPSFRGSAHQLATTLLHNHPSSKFRLAIIKSTIADCGPFESLKEVAINWLKEEIIFTIPHPSKPTTSTLASDNIKTQPSSTDEHDNIFASPTLFSEDEALSSLSLPTQSSAPIASVSLEQSQPALPTSTPTQAPTPSSNPTTLTQPIAALNLLFLLLTNPTLKSRYNLASKITSLQSSLTTAAPPPPPSPSTTTATTATTFESKALHYLTSMQTFVDENAGVGTKEEEGRLGLLGLAVGRVVGALEGYQRGP